MNMTTPPALWPRRLLAALIRAYRFFLSPWLGSACRFEPTCSRYALDAIEAHGAAAGAYLAARRVLRCHPWCHGGHDPVSPSPSSESHKSLFS
jgi:uncharacterized protein